MMYRMARRNRPSFMIPAWLVLFVVPAATSAVGQESQTAVQNSSAESLTFAAFGDIPYSEVEFPLMRRQLAELEPSLPFIFHVGDIKLSSAPFGEDAYSRVADELKQSRVPVFITLGDNEYNDTADPELALSYWKKYFGDLHEHWQHGLDVRYQPTRRENVAFVHQGVLFIMINLVGSKVHDAQEWAVRLKDDADWITTELNRCGDQACAAVIIAHSIANGSRKSVGDALTASAAKFAKPILYVHGDGHRWIQDRPFPAAQNILRIQVDQGALAPPVRITVGASQVDGDIFSFERGITEEYLRLREEYRKNQALKVKKPVPATTVE